MARAVRHQPRPSLRQHRHAHRRADQGGGERIVHVATHESFRESLSPMGRNEVDEAQVNFGDFLNVKTFFAGKFK